MELPEDLERWRNDWTRRHDRPPSILHIGNIANNAYNNAKLLIKAGFDCDVVCYDYYHMMGCPEWEDADFAGDVDDHFKPDWTKVDAPGYVRPAWFVQGPMGLCLDYLLASRRGDTRQAKRIWRLMGELNGTRKPTPFDLHYQKLNLRFHVRRFLIGLVSPPKFQYRIYEFIGKVENALRERAQFRPPVSPQVQRNPSEFWPMVLFRALIPKSLRRIIPTRILCRAYVCVIALEQLMGWLIKVLGAQQSGTNKLRNIAKFLSVEVLPRVGLLLFGGFRLLLSTIVSLYVFCGGLVLKSVRKITRQLVRYHQAAPPQSEDVVFARTADLFRDCMPDREDQLELDDIISNLYILPRWIELFEYYDVVIGYSTDPIWPFLAQKKYFALEHGTLREIPFEANRQGRLTALSYRYAEHAFVTNFDCISNAKILCGDRFSFINHPYDEDHGLAISGVDVLRKDLCRELDADFLVFFPTRQDWVKDTGYADKANDVFIRAFCRLREAGYRIGMVCCDWGRNVAQTKSLLKDHQAARYVRWEEPMGIIRFERMSRACNLVADQFKLGAFGGVTFKALAVGVPVCTFLDGELLHGLYPELPPVINCRDERSIFSELETLMNQPEQLDALSKASRAWIKEHHSGRDVVVAQLRQFKATLENTTGATDSLCAAN